MSDSREQRLKAIISLSALITSSLDPREVRRLAVAAATSLVDAEAGSLFLLDEERGELFFEIAHGEKGEAIKDLRLQKGEGIAGWVVEKGVPLLVADARSDQRFCSHMDEKSSFITKNIICVPVTVRGKAIGALEAINRRKGKFSNKDVELLDLLAQQVAVALENARLYEENSRYLSNLIDQERRHRLEKERLVKDLHDGIGGVATNISMLAEIAGRGNEAVMEGGLATIAELSREMINELRTFMNTMESNELTWHDLAAEIRRHGTSMLAPHGTRFDFSAHLKEPEGEVGMFLYLSIFRIAKEGIANIAKHAGASVATVILEALSDSCSLSIRDDGCGTPAMRKEGRGLRNMHSRAADLNGYLEVLSPPGTTVILRLPLPFSYSPDTGGSA